jgi:hypothetical protein
VPPSSASQRKLAAHEPVTNQAEWTRNPTVLPAACSRSAAQLAHDAIRPWQHRPGVLARHPANAAPGPEDLLKRLCLSDALDVDGWIIERSHIEVATPGAAAHRSQRRGRPKLASRQQPAAEL